MPVILSIYAFAIHTYSLCFQIYLKIQSKITPNTNGIKHTRNYARTKINGNSTASVRCIAIYAHVFINFHIW